MQIVKFKDGNYGIREVVGGEATFLDLTDTTKWWPIEATYTRILKGSLTECKTILATINDIGEPIDD